MTEIVNDYSHLKTLLPTQGVQGFGRKVRVRCLEDEDHAKGKEGIFLKDKVDRVCSNLVLEVVFLLF